MKFSWWKALIILSLGLNCMIAGAVAYRYFFGGPLSRPHGPGTFWDDIPQQNQAAHAELREKMSASREKMHAARTRIMESLGAQTPDRTRISGELDTINKLQADMERMVIDQMLQDVQALPRKSGRHFWLIYSAAYSAEGVMVRAWVWACAGAGMTTADINRTSTLISAGFYA